MRLLVIVVLGVILVACGGGGNGDSGATGDRVPDIPDVWVDIVPAGGVLVELAELSDELQGRVNAWTAVNAFVNLQLVRFRRPLGDFVLLVSEETSPVAIADHCLAFREFTESEFWSIDCPS